MSISLTKGQKIDLTKGNPGLSKVLVGLGWDVNKYDGGFDFDLDASAFLIDASGKTDAEVYHKANLTRQHFSKIRSNPGYKPSKPTALALAVALELDLAQTKDLIARAGYALTNASEFDVIVSFFILQKLYDLFLINSFLFKYDQPLLGAS